MLKDTSKKFGFLSCAVTLAVICLFYDFCPVFAGQRKNSKQLFQWSEMPAILVSSGLSGSFCGVSNGALIVAGGVSFLKNDEGQVEKSWHDSIFVTHAIRAL